MSPESITELDSTIDSKETNNNIQITDCEKSAKEQRSKDTLKEDSTICKETCETFEEDAISTKGEDFVGGVEKLQKEVAEKSKETDKDCLEINISDENGFKSKLNIDFDVRCNVDRNNRNCRSSESSDLSDSDSNNSINLDVLTQDERRCSTGGLLEKKVSVILLHTVPYAIHPNQ